MKNKLLLIVMIGVCFLVSKQAIAEEYIASMTSYPPFLIFNNSNKTLGGINVDVLDLFQKENPAYKLIYKYYPVKRSRRLEEKGIKIIDITIASPSFMSREMLEKFEYTTSLVRTKDKIIYKKESPLVYKAPRDLFGKKVGVLLGYGYGLFDRLFKEKKIHAQYVKTQIQNIQKLNIGRIDAYIGNIHVSPYFMKQLKLNPDNFTFSASTLYEFDYGPFVTKREPELRKALTQFIEKIKTNGDLEKIIINYTK